jgi:hypothetical protein
VFLIRKGVESESLDTEVFKITEEMRSFVEGVERSRCEPQIRGALGDR